MTEMNYHTEAGVHDMMYEHASRRGQSLRYGVGNDMTTPFYTHLTAREIMWWPDGINGSPIRVRFGKTLSEYNPGFESS